MYFCYKCPEFLKEVELQNYYEESRFNIISKQTDKSPFQTWRKKNIFIAVHERKKCLNNHIAAAHEGNIRTLVYAICNVSLRVEDRRNKFSVQFATQSSWIEMA